MAKDEQKVAISPSKKGTKRARATSKSKSRRHAPNAVATAIGRKLFKNEVENFAGLLASRGLSQKQFCDKLIEACRASSSADQKSANVGNALRQLQYVLSKNRKLNAPLAADYAKTLNITIKKFDDQLRSIPNSLGETNRVKLAPALPALKVASIAKTLTANVPMSPDGVNQILESFSTEFSRTKKSGAQLVDYYKFFEHPSIWTEKRGELLAVSHNEIQQWWVLREVYSIYEQHLIRFQRENGTVNRVFVFRYDEFENPSVCRTFCTIGYRHRFLGFEPRYATQSSLHLSRNRVGVECDSHVVINRQVVYFSKPHVDGGIVTVRVDKPTFVDKAARCHEELLTEARSFDFLLNWLKERKDFQLHTADIEESEREAKLIIEADEFCRRAHQKQ